MTQFAAASPAVGFVILVLGAVTYFSPTPDSAEQTLSPAIIEQKLAIEEAERTGQNTYSYTTGFTPGLGNMTQERAQEIIDENSQPTEQAPQ